MKTFIQLLFAALFLTSCSQSNNAVNVQELNQQFISAWNTRDASKVTSFLADDVHFLQGSAHFSGKGDVARRWVEETIPTINNLRISVVTSGVDDKIAYEAGKFTVDVLPSGPDQPAGIGEGNYILLWKKADDNSWKLSYAQLEDLPVQVRPQQ